MLALIWVGSDFPDASDGDIVMSVLQERDEGISKVEA